MLKRLIVATRWVVAASSLVLLAMSLLAGAASAQGSELRRLAIASEFVFEGTVSKVGAGTMPAVPISARTVVVRVRDVLMAPPHLVGLEGTDVTVNLREGKSARVGDRAIFFAKGWLYGRGVALIEVGRAAVVGPVVRSQVVAAVAAARDEPLRLRLAQAELVGAGTVLSVRPVRTLRRSPVTEHDPNWAEAVIRVRSVLKGRRGADSVVVIFPQSRDVMWYRAPKPQIGHERIWVLRRQRLPSFSLSQFALHDSLDVRPLSSLPQVRRLLGLER